MPNSQAILVAPTLGPLSCKITPLAFCNGTVSSSPSSNGTAGSDRAVSAFNRGRPVQIEGPSDQPSCRGSDREADAHARCGERIVLAPEGQHALAAADPDNELAFREYDDDVTGLGARDGVLKPATPTSKAIRARRNLQQIST